MIPQIREINFGPGTDAAYATLHEATISFADMGERSITTQVRIDGDVVPEFDNWELKFKGERFVLPVKEPQAQKNNTTRNSLVDLTFYSWPIYQMKRYFFFETTTTATGTVMADKYKASVNLNLTNFVALFNRVLNYYFGGTIVADLASGSYGTEVASINLDYSYIWDVLQDFYSIFGVRWYIEYDSVNDVYTIKIGYAAPVISDHEFEYGYQGGLLHFERQVQDDNIKNILLGRGGEKNVPYRYFKATDPNNPEWAADPDAIPELANVYFDRIRDINFRNYVQGWKAKHYGGTYDSSRAQSDWAYAKGYTDATFDPVEYVKNDASITKYGERWGALDDNEDIFPTIQGIIRGGYGRVDEVVAVSPIVTDDIYGLADASANIVSLHGVMTQVGVIPAHGSVSAQLRGEEFTIPTGMVANLNNNGFFAASAYTSPYDVFLVVDESSRIRVYDAATDTELASGASGIPAGTYYYVVDITVNNEGSYVMNSITYGVNGLDLVVSDANPNSWKPTFDIWVKNIWETQKGQNESDEDYALRVWGPILGDHLGNEAKVVFSDGFMAVSEDYEFVIASYPVHDDSKIIGSYRSEWKITLYKSDAEFDVSGLYIPNSTSGGSPAAGDHFFFTGIDMPYMYVTLAEERLNVYKTSALNQTKDVNPTWVIQFDKIRMNESTPQTQSFFDRIGTGTEVHVRDKRFTNNEILRLFVNTLTYTWHEPTDSNPYLLPDVEMVVSDKIVVEKSPVEKIQGDLDILKSTYAKMSDMEAVIQQVASPMFLKKTGESETSLSPTKFASMVSSRDFRQGGVGGQGWGLYRDNSSVYQPEEQSQTRQTRSASPESEQVSDSVMEVDKLVVRKEMHVNNLVVNQITYMGGKQITSAAAMECVQVVETDTSYICYLDQRQGSVKNLFVVNDIAYGQVFEPDNTVLRYYKMLVTAVDVDSITLAKSGRDGTGAPKKGDTIVQFGNTTDTDRQFVIIRDVIGGGYERMLSGLNSTTATGQEYYFAGCDTPSGGNPQARFFVGGSNSSMEFSQAEGQLKIRGTIVQSSGSTPEHPIESLVTCYRGDYSGSTPYYRGDEITYSDGNNYIYISTEPSSGHAPGDNLYWKKRTSTGSSARLVEVEATSLIFAYADSTATEPTGDASIGLTAKTQNIANPTYKWYRWDGTDWTQISGETSQTLGVYPPTDSIHSEWASYWIDGQLRIKVIISDDENLYDEVSLHCLYGGKDGTSGQDGIVAFLTNTSHLFPAGESAVTSSTNDTFEVRVFKGVTPLTYAASGSADGTFTIGEISSISNLTVSKNGSGVISVTAEVGLSTASGVLSVPVTINSGRASRQVTLDYSWALSFKGAAGAAGSSAKLLSITADSMIFSYADENARHPVTGEDSFITLTAIGENIPSTVTFAWYYKTAQGGWSFIDYTRDGETFSVGYPEYNATWGNRWDGRTNLPIRVSGAGLSDEITIYKVCGGADGDGGITAFLTNQSHLFAAGESAAVAGSDSFEVVVFKGLDKLAVGSGFTIGYITGQVTGLTTSVSGATVTVSVTSDLTDASGVLTIPVAVGSETINLKYSWALSFTGTQGARGSKGPKLRGPTTWTSGKSYESGTTTDFQDIVLDGTSYYLCVVDNPQSSINPGDDLYNQSTGDGHWAPFTQEEYMATKVFFAERSKIDNLVIDYLYTTDEDGVLDFNPISIHGNTITIADSDPSSTNYKNDQVIITSDHLDLASGEGDVSLTNQSGVISFTAPGSATIDTTLTLASISVTGVNNAVTLPQIKLYPLSIPSGTSFQCYYQVYIGDRLLESGTLPTTATSNNPKMVGGGTFTLPVGTHGYSVVLSGAFYSTPAATGSKSLTIRAYKNSQYDTATIAYSNDTRAIATNGLYLSYGTQGIRLDSNGAKVIQSGQEYNMAGLGLYGFASNATLPKRIVFCNGSYPGSMEPGVFYIKVNS